MRRRVILPPEEKPGPEGVKAAGWWHESDDGRKLVCDLCPRGCELGPGKRGFCFVRQNLRGQQIVSTTYGRSTGFCIDPIEKKPLNHFYPGTAVLSFGTAGCNLGCKFCQNWSMSKSREVESLSETADPETIAEAARRHACRSVAFTYNDPIIFAEYAIDTAWACHQLGIKTVAVTNGYIAPVARSTFFEAMDAANVDLKAFSEEFYWKLTGGHLEPVLDTLKWLVHQSDVWVEIANLIIPEANDSADELERMCQWVLKELGPDVPVHFTAFHPDFRMTDRGSTPPETLCRARDIARRAGLNYVYTGNVSDRQGQSTYCPSCGRVLIERDGYHLGVYSLEHDRCRHCGTQIAGRFEDGPGDWGSRRMPVRISAYARPKPNKPSGETTMEAENPKQPDSEKVVPERPLLTPQQESLVFQAAGRRVAAAVQSSAPERMDLVLADAADRPVLGAFVSLKRGGQLRSCCGFLGQSVPLHEALDHAAVRAAKDDPRFPPISPTELDHLHMEVWLLWGLQEITARGKDRISAVTIGKHGLQIARGAARGLLLPGVAVEHRLDAETFLEHVCHKAGLPPDAWKDDDTTLMTFEGYAISGPLQATVAGARRVPGTGPPSQTVDGTRHVPTTGGPTQAEVARLADFCRQNLLTMIQGGTPSFYLPDGYDGAVNGIALTVQIPGREEKIQSSTVSLRPEMPLQSTLFELVKSAVRSLQSGRFDPSALQRMTVGLTVLWDPAMQGTVAELELEGLDPQHRAVLVIHRSKWAFAYDPGRQGDELLEEVVQRARLPDPAGGTVCSLAAISTEPPVVVSNVPRPQPGASIRPPAVAGRFYPGDPQELERTLDDLLPSGARPEPWAAAMVPHAGWVYSGRLAAEVFSRVQFPPQVIIVCPKHNPVGADWAVTPHQTWSLPGGDVDSDPELAQRLADAIGGLELDAAAHGPEHSIEVQLPLVARLAPHSRVLGIAIYGGDLPSLQRFAEQLAGVLGEMPERPLLVISSDMNHYADDQQTRRLDRLALDAMESLDPARLYETVKQHRITMCGVLPAVLVMETLRRLDSLNRFQSVGYATSADVSGDTRRVVGYAGMLFA